MTAALVAEARWPTPKDDAAPVETISGASPGANGQRPAPAGEEVLLRYSGPVPRYTSYPTAVHFSPEVDAGVYRRWLGEIGDDERLSLYVHVPFCRSLCWFCGCQTTVARDPAVVDAYASVLRTEVGMVRDAMSARPLVTHLHLGGGTPTMLGAEGLHQVVGAMLERFAFAGDAELAIETDPRTLTADVARALGALGFNRASLGIQDLDPEVQRSIHREQPLPVSVAAATMLRDNGIDRISIDLMIGLPHQTAGGVRETAEIALEALQPDRVSVFAYAHVPWMKRHQKLIDAAALPDARERLVQARAVAAALQHAGYVAIGLDHFARPDDPLARAAASGRLHRNFQGYTDDAANSLIGFGASAIGSLPGGYVQNTHLVPDYRRAIASGTFATTRGAALTRDDRMRRDVIERLMCDMRVDLDDVARRWDADPIVFSEAIAALTPMEADGIVQVTGRRVEVPEAGRLAVRSVCAAFDSYLAAGNGRHAPGI